ncbi:MAG: hypothetical protein H6922_00515 [Pseudomonadaceae bacterium]|nr:hypothetical protein [Pseudomonadaceae bacterium]
MGLNPKTAIILQISKNVGDKTPVYIEEIELNLSANVSQEIEIPHHEVHLKEGAIVKEPLTN